MERRAYSPQPALCRLPAGTAHGARPGPLMRATERFSSRVGNYARYRPSYAHGAIALLQGRCGLGPGAVVADIGSGTGILARQLLASGALVMAVEPNGEMRAAAEAQLGGEPSFRSVRGSAEATTLAAASIDLLVAGQAFHWFDAARARREALRVMRAAGWGALLWNERPAQATPFLEDYEALLMRCAAEYGAIKASRADEAVMHDFFGGAMQLATFPNQQDFDLAGLEGRLMSSSYAPEAGHPQHQPMLAGLREVFARHARDGRVEFPYQTLVYFGRLRA